MNDVPRGEYPRPQFVRKDWLCLNGPWEFEIDPGDTGLERGLRDRPLKDRILVPFCPESPLSGIGNTDYLNAVWYRRQVRIPPSWAGRKVLLHFQAVDYDATVWVDGVETARHRGAFTPFTCDLEGLAVPGESCVIVVRARDPKGARIPRGKQASKYANTDCHYTRTTGIWQSVWLEPVPPTHLLRPRLTPDAANGLIRLLQPITNTRPGTRLRATLTDSAGVVSAAQCAADADFAVHLDLAVPKDRRRPWGPDDPHLYGLRVELLDAAGSVLDAADAYAGLRSVTLDGKAVLLNGRAIFQRLVLDQGFYPDGIWTAPSDGALERDIRLAREAGFNGARLHQKVFEERFLYHADHLGYLVWGEFGDWGIDRDDPPLSCLTQWLEVLHRDSSHPCIVGWCPLNETARGIRDALTNLDDLTRGLFLATKALDLSRPVLDTSGYSHRVPESDVYDCHDYTQDPGELRERQAGLAGGKPFVNGLDAKDGPWSLPYRGQPFFVSEFGGTWWNASDAAASGAGGDRKASWGYGRRPQNVEEFSKRFEGLCAVLLENPNMFGYCYTQLTDVFQEQNGLYAFDRTPKFDIARLRAAQQRPAAIETARGGP